jgi:hypothetical protein
MKRRLTKRTQITNTKKKYLLLTGLMVFVTGRIAAEDRNEERMSICIRMTSAGSEGD